MSILKSRLATNAERSAILGKLRARGHHLVADDLERGAGVFVHNGERLRFASSASTPTLRYGTPVETRSGPDGSPCAVPATLPALVADLAGITLASPSAGEAPAVVPSAVVARRSSTGVDLVADAAAVVAAREAEQVNDPLDLTTLPI